MTPVRLLPVVIFAMAALLLFKTAGLLGAGSYVLGGTQLVVAQDVTGEAAGGDDGALTSSDLAAAENAADTLFSERPEPPPQEENVVVEVENKAGERIAITTADGTGLTEKAVLQRLSDRRAELDTYAGELEVRLSLVEAAEKRLDERVASLKGLEERIEALVEQKKAMSDTQFAALVSMYETMKPASAASVFNQLDMGVLVRVARAMNPRKMAPVLAKMATNRAQELTVRLASAEVEPTLDAPIEDLAALPQIVGQ